MDELEKHDEQFEAYLRQFRLRTPSPLPEIASLNRRSSLRWFVAAAAAVVLIVGLSSMFVRRPALDAPRAIVSEAGNPSLYKVGETIEASRVIRSNSAVGLVLDLNDGSKIEMRAQSELQLEAAADGIRVRLNDGSIIVTAAKQGAGHLYVQTRDVTVSVVGTVFLVNAEQAGTQVAVVEGEVRVQQGTTLKTLLPGEQMASSPSIALQLVAQGIAWSRKASEYAAMLPQQAATAPTRSLPVSEPGPSGGSLPFNVRVQYVKITPVQVQTLITVQFRNRDLTFQDANGGKTAEAHIAGALYRSDNRQLQPISHDVNITMTDRQFREALDQPVLYQETRWLTPGRYELQLTVEDKNSQSVGVQTIALTVPGIPDRLLDASSMILAYSITDRPSGTTGTDMFASGDYIVIPSVSREFRRDQSLNVWVEIYGLAVDSNTRKPSATFELVISQNKREVMKILSDSSQLKGSGPQLQYISTVSLADFAPGQYDILLRATDNLAPKQLAIGSKFSLVASLTPQMQAPARITQLAPASNNLGREIFLRACGTCHDANVTQRKALPSRDEYANLVSREMGKGAALSSTEVPVLIDYLFKMFGVPVPRPTSDDPGRETFLRACTGCHDEYVAQPKALPSRDEYANLVSRMMGYGATLSSTEVPVMIDYLFKTFGIPSDVPLQRPPFK